MKLKIICIVLTVIVISVMWTLSPRQKYLSCPEVEVVLAETEDVYDTVVTRGYIRENNKKDIRLEKTASVENVYVSVGDYVKKDAVLIDVCEKENELSDITQVSNFLPEISDVSDIMNFYIPKKVDNITKVTPEIKAPITGIVTELAVKKGDIALGQVPIITISNFDDLSVIASVPENYIKDIKIGQKAEITGDAFSGKKHIAYISEISPIAVQKTTLTGNSETTVEVTLAFVSKPVNLRPGYSVNAKIFTKNHKNAITIPYTCIFQEHDKEYVYTVNDNKITRKAIKTGFELEDRVEVRLGINKFDIIINNPRENFEDDMKIRIKS